MIVLFDGTPSKPWGRYLDAHQEIPKDAPQLRRPSPETNCAIVLDTILARPSTRAEIAARTGLQVPQVRYSLGELLRQGLIRSESRETRRCFGGIAVSVRYHAVGKWERP